MASLEKKRIFPVDIEADPAELALVVHYTQEIETYDDVGQLVKLQKQPHKKRIRLKGLNPDTNVADLAESIMAKCADIIAEDRLGKLIDLLTDLQVHLVDRDAPAPAPAPAVAPAPLPTASSAPASSSARPVSLAPVAAPVPASSGPTPSIAAGKPPRAPSAREEPRAAATSAASASSRPGSAAGMGASTPGSSPPVSPGPSGLGLLTISTAPGSSSSSSSSSSASSASSASMTAAGASSSHFAPGVHGPHASPSSASSLSPFSFPTGRSEMPDLGPDPPAGETDAAMIEFAEKAAQRRALESEARMGDVDDYMELLYEEDLDAKLRGATLVLGLMRRTENMEALLQNETLMGALARVLRDDFKKNLDLTTTLVQIFYCLAQFSQVHGYLTTRRIGDVTFKIVELEHRRHMARIEDMVRLVRLAEIQAKGTPADEEAFRQLDEERRIRLNEGGGGGGAGGGEDGDGDGGEGGAKGKGGKKDKTGGTKKKDKKDKKDRKGRDRGGDGKDDDSDEDGRGAARAGEEGEDDDDGPGRGRDGGSDDDDDDGGGGGGGGGGARSRKAGKGRSGGGAGGSASGGLLGGTTGGGDEADPNAKRIKLKPLPRGRVDLEREKRKMKLIVKRQERLLFFCFGILLNLAEQLEIERKMVKRGIVGLLVAVLDRTLPDLLTLVLTFLRKLSLFEECKDAMGEEEAPERATRLISAEQDEGVSLAALRLLFNLSFDPKLCRAMVRAGVVQKVVPLLRTPALRAIILRLLYHLSADERHRVAFASTEAANFVMRLVVNFPKPVLNLELVALAVNLASHARTAELMIRGDGLKALIQRVAKHGDANLMKVVRALSQWTLQLQMQSAQAVVLNRIRRGAQAGKRGSGASDDSDGPGAEDGGESSGAGGGGRNGSEGVLDDDERAVRGRPTARRGAVDAPRGGSRSRSGSVSGTAAAGGAGGRGTGPGGGSRAGSVSSVRSRTEGSELGDDEGGDGEETQRGANFEYPFEGLWAPHVKELLRFLRAETPELLVEVVGTLANLTPRDMPEGITFLDLVRTPGVLEVIEHNLSGRSGVADDLVLEFVNWVGALVLEAGTDEVLAGSHVPELLAALLSTKARDCEMVMQVITALYRMLHRPRLCAAVLERTDAMLQLTRFLTDDNPRVAANAEATVALAQDWDEEHGKEGVWRRLQAARFHAHNREWCTMVSTEMAARSAARSAARGGSGGGGGGRPMRLRHHLDDGVGGEDDGEDDGDEDDEDDDEDEDEEGIGPGRRGARHPGGMHDLSDSNDEDGRHLGRYTHEMVAMDASLLARDAEYEDEGHDEGSWSGGAHEDEESGSRDDPRTRPGVGVGYWGAR